MADAAAAAAGGAAGDGGAAPAAAVAAAVLAQFAALPKTGKPQPHEHTVLAGIALSLPPLQQASSGGSRDGGAVGRAGGARGEPPAASAAQQQPQQQPCHPLEDLAVVAIGTGTKCLGARKRLPGGAALNDCHAEALCRRALLRWLYSEMLEVVQRYTAAAAQQAAAGSAAGGLDQAALAAAAASGVLRLVQPSGGNSAGALCGGWRFELQPGVRLHMYVSQPPCGDASILGLPADGELQEAAGAAVGGGAGPHSAAYGRTGAKPVKRQRLEGAQQLQQEEEEEQQQQQQQAAPQAPPQWALPQQHEVESYAEEQRTGLVRRKPGRGDATLSLACSDKLARWCLLGVQGSLLSSLLAAPLHLASVTVTAPPAAAPAGQPAPDSPAELAAAAEAALRRALLGRTAQLARERLPPGWQQAAPALRIHLPAAGAGSSGRVSLQELGLAPTAARKVAGGSSVIWVAPPSSAFRFKPSPQQPPQPAAGAGGAGGAAAVAHPSPPAVLSGGTVEAVAGGSGLKLGAARAKPGQAPHPSAQPSICKAALFGAWRQLVAALQRLPAPGGAAGDASAHLPAAAAAAVPPAAGDASMGAAQAAPAAAAAPVATGGLSYRAAKRQAGGAYAAAWAALLAPPSPLEGWIPKPPQLEEFGAEDPSS